MKVFFVFCVFLLSFSAVAKGSREVPVRLPFVEVAVPAGVTLIFQKVPVNDFISVILGDVFHLNFALDPSLVALEQTVTVSFNNSSNKVVYAYLMELLDSLGIQYLDRGAYFLLKPSAANKGKEVFFYRARYRSVAYIVDLIGNLFPDSKFSFQSGNMLNSVVSPAGLSKSADASGSQKSVVSAPSSGDAKAPSESRKDSDAFLFEGNAEDTEKLKRLLLLIDTPVGEVSIRAVLYEVGSIVDSGNAVGLALTLLGGKFGITFGQSSVSANSVKFSSSAVDAVFSALATDSRFRIISSPSLRVKSGSHAVISVGSDVPVLGSISTDVSGRSTQSVSMQASGVILDILPTVNDAGIDLTFKQQISNFIPTTTGVNNSPTLVKREVSSVIGTSFDQFVIMGGLNQIKVNSDTSGFSFLPSWSRSDGSDITTSEILLVLHIHKI